MKFEETEISKDRFINAIEKFMQMKNLNAFMLRELVEKIEVYHTEGVGKNRTQDIVIHYKFIGTLEMPQRKPDESYNPLKLLDESYTLDWGQGVAVSYYVKVG